MLAEPVNALALSMSSVQNAQFSWLGASECSQLSCYFERDFPAYLWRC
jgi:hypothetical protein